MVVGCALWISGLVGCADFQTTTDGGGPQCVTGEKKCEDSRWMVCTGGRWVIEDCGKDNKSCIDGLGCRLCVPNSKYCKGLDAYQCSADGNSEKKLKTCRPDQQCALGECFDFCDLPQSNRSNVGCEFWAVDLPNEYYCMSIDGGATCMTYGCAACQQFSVAIANTSGYNVTITVDGNLAKPGEPLKVAQVRQVTVGPDSLEVIDLPMREVDCSEWYKDKNNRLRRKGESYTCLSSTAYRIRASYPVVAYQFNPIVNEFSNGASLLIPINGLDKDYYILGWSTANPIAMPMPGQAIEGVPDRTNITVVGVEDNTQVDVTLTHPTQASKDDKIPAGKKGDTISVTLGPFDVLNINSNQDLGNMTGDLTGSLVKADKPVAVFSAAQRALVPGFPLSIYNPKPPEPGEGYDVCCTEHFEQQMLPISSLGKSFIITRSPIRSKGSPEPDFYRILGTEDGTKITTNLSDFPSFNIDNGQVADFWATKGFTVSSDKPIMIAQYAVCQGFMDSYTVGGDPEFVVFPPVEQYRKEYIFLTPTTFSKDYVVIGAPSAAVITLDDKEISGEFKTLCTQYSIGKLGTTDYVSYHCDVADGVHRVGSTEAVGIMVYGYYSVGSYGYPGGADVKQINID
jgi:hypothetical protein